MQYCTVCYVKTLLFKESSFFLSLSLSLAGPFTASISSTGYNITVSWVSMSLIAQQQLRSVRINVIPECETRDPFQAQLLVVLPTEGNSRIVTGLGSYIAVFHFSTFNNLFFLDPFIPYHVYVAARICDATFELYNETVFTQSSTEHTYISSWSLHKRGSCKSWLLQGEINLLFLPKILAKIERFFSLEGHSCSWNSGGHSQISCKFLIFISRWSGCSCACQCDQGHSNQSKFRHFFQAGLPTSHHHVQHCLLRWEHDWPGSSSTSLMCICFSTGYFPLQTSSAAGSFRTTSRSDITLANLDPCMNYSLIVTAIDCTSRVSTSPQLITTYVPSTGRARTRARG